MWIWCHHYLSFSCQRVPQVGLAEMKDPEWQAGDMNKKWLAWSGVFAHQTVITPGYGQWVEREEVSEQLTSSTPTPVSPMLNCSFPSKVHFRKALGKKKNAAWWEIRSEIWGLPQDELVWNERTWILISLTLSKTWSSILSLSNSSISFSVSTLCHTFYWAACVCMSDLLLPLSLPLRTTESSLVWHGQGPQRLDLNLWRLLHLGRRCNLCRCSISRVAPSSPSHPRAPYFTLTT